MDHTISLTGRSASIERGFAHVVATSPLHVPQSVEPASFIHPLSHLVFLCQSTHASLYEPLRCLSAMTAWCSATHRSNLWRSTVICAWAPSGAARRYCAGQEIA